MHLDDVVQKYNAASKHYDRLMDVVFGKVLGAEQHRERIVELLGDVRGGTVVDVGCGTGRNFSLLANSVGEHGRVIGIDYSDGMLDEARRRVEQHGWRNVELMRGDAVTLDGLHEPVDAIVSAWCYGTVYDLEGALNRAVDVLRPGGRLAIMTFTRACPERGPLRWLYPFYRFAVRCAGADPSRDFDNAALEAKWKHGREVLRARVGDLHEEPYLQGAGLILAARKPAQTQTASQKAPAGESSMVHGTAAAP